MQSDAPLDIKMTNAVIDAESQFGSSLFKVEFHVTYSALYKLRTEAYINNSTLFSVRTDVDPIHCEVYGYKICPMRGDGVRVELHVQVCRNSPNTVICVC